MVFEILWYKQTNRQTDIVLLCIIDKNKEDLVLGTHMYDELLINVLINLVVE